MWVGRERGLSELRRWKIAGYIGPNGSGKSLLAVSASLAALDAGRPVLSTVRLLDWRDPRPCGDDQCHYDGHPDHGAAHPLWLPFDCWDALLDSPDHIDVLMDEVAGIASSRGAMNGSGGMPAAVEAFLQKLRKRDAVLRWTAPAWSRADRIIRECTQAAIVCSGFLPRRVPGSDWPSHTLFRARTVDARALDELTSGAATKAPAATTFFARLAKLPARDAYDTLGDVMTLPEAQGGACIVCGGRRRARQCRCDEGGSPRTEQAERGAPARGARRLLGAEVGDS